MPAWGSLDAALENVIQEKRKRDEEEKKRKAEEAARKALELQRAQERASQNEWVNREQPVSRQFPTLQQLANPPRVSNPPRVQEQRYRLPDDLPQPSVGYQAPDPWRDDDDEDEPSIPAPVQPAPTRITPTITPYQADAPEIKPWQDWTGNKWARGRTMTGLASAAPPIDPAKVMEEYEQRLQPTPHDPGDSYMGFKPQSQQRVPTADILRPTFERNWWDKYAQPFLRSVAPQTPQIPAYRQWTDLFREGLPPEETFSDTPGGRLAYNKYSNYAQEQEDYVNSLPDRSPSAAAEITRDQLQAAGKSEPLADIGAGIAGANQWLTNLGVQDALADQRTKWSRFGNQFYQWAKNTGLTELPGTDLPISSYLGAAGGSINQYNPFNYNSTVLPTVADAPAPPPTSGHQPLGLGEFLMDAAGPAAAEVYRALGALPTRSLPMLSLLLMGTNSPYYQNFLQKTGAYNQEQLNRMRGVKAEIEAAPPELKPLYELAMVNAISNSVPETLDALKKQKELPAAMEQQAMALKFTGDELGAAQLYAQAQALRRMTPQQIVDQFANPWAEAIEGFLFDPTTYTDIALGLAFRRGVPALVGGVIDAADAVRGLDEAADVAQSTLTSLARGQTPAQGAIPWYQRMFRLTPDSAAHAAKDTLWREIGTLVAQGVTSKPEARNLMAVLTTMPKRLLSDLPQNLRTSLRSVQVMGEEMGVSPNVLAADDVLKQFPVLGVARERLLNMRSLAGDGGLNPEEFMAELDDVLYTAARKVYGAEAATLLPEGATDVRLRRLPDGRGVLEYVGPNKKVIASGLQPLEWDEARSVYNQTRKLLSKPRTGLGKGIVKVGGFINNVQRGLLSDLYLHSDPRNWVRQALSAAGHLAGDGNLGLITRERILGELSGYGNGMLPDPRLMELAEGAQDAVSAVTGEGMQNWTRSFWPKYNPYAKLMEAGAGVWQRNEQALWGVGYHSGFTKTFGRLWDFKLKTEFLPKLHEIGADEELAQAVVEGAVADASRGVNTVLSNLRRGINANRVRARLRNVFVPDDILPPAARAEMEDGLAQFAPEDVQRAQVYVSEFIERERLRRAGIVQAEGTAPGVDVLSETADVQDAADLAAAGGNTPEIIEETTRHAEALRTVRAALLQDMAEAPDLPRAAQVVYDTLERFDEIMVGVRARIDAINAQARMAGGGPAWDEASTQVQGVVSEMSRRVQALFAERREMLGALERGEELPPMLRWGPAIERYQAMDFEAIEDARMAEAGSISADPIGFKRIIDAGRAAWDGALAESFFTLKRWPTARNADLVFGAVDKLRELEVDARAYLMPWRQRAQSEGGQAWEVYFGERNAVQRKVYDDAIAWLKATQSNIVADGVLGGGRPTGNAVQQVQTTLNEIAQEAQRAAAPTPAAGPVNEYRRAFGDLAGAMGMDETWRRSVQATGYLPDAERTANGGSLINQIYERLIQEGRPRGQDTLDTAIEIGKQAHWDSKQAGAAYRAVTQAATPTPAAAGGNVPPISPTPTPGPTPVQAVPTMDDLRKLAADAGIATTDKTGQVKIDDHLRRVINKDTGTNVSSLGQLSPAERIRAAEALQARIAKKNAPPEPPDVSGALQPPTMGAGFVPIPGQRVEELFGVPADPYRLSPPTPGGFDPWRLGRDGVDLRAYIARQTARAARGTPQGTVGEVARTTIRFLDQYERLITENLPNLLAGTPNQMTPQQRVAATDLLPQLRTLYGEVFDEAARAGREAADFSLLNYNKRRGVDAAMGTTFPFHYYWTRSGMNWAKRIARHPSILNAYYEKERAKEIENQKAGVQDTRAEGTFPNPLHPFLGGPQRIADFVDWLIPMSMFTPNQFHDPSEADNPVDQAVSTLLQWTPAPYPLPMLAFDAAMDQLSPRGEGPTRMDEYKGGSYIWPWRALHYGQQAVTGDQPKNKGFATGGKPFDAYVTLRTIAVLGKEAGVSAPVTSFAMQYALNQARGIPVHTNIPDEYFAQAEAFAQRGTRRAGVENLVMEGTRHFIGTPTYYFRPAEQELRGLGEQWHSLGYDPFKNPLGSKQAMRAFMDVNPELSSWWSKSAGVPGYKGVTPGESAQFGLMMDEKEGIYAKFAAEKEKFITDHPGIESDKDAYYAFEQAWKARQKAEIDAAEAKYPDAAANSSEDKQRGMNPQELNEAAIENARAQAQALAFQSVYPGREAGDYPSYPGDEASSEAKSAYFDNQDAYDKAYQDHLDALLKDKEWLQQSVGGRPLGEMGPVPGKVPPVPQRPSPFAPGPMPFGRLLSEEPERTTIGPPTRAEAFPPVTGGPAMTRPPAAKSTGRMADTSDPFAVSKPWDADAKEVIQAKKEEHYVPGEKELKDKWQAESDAAQAEYDQWKPYNDAFYAFGDDYDAKRAYLNEHPEYEEYLRNDYKRKGYDIWWLGESGGGGSGGYGGKGGNRAKGGKGGRSGGGGDWSSNWDEYHSLESSADKAAYLRANPEFADYYKKNYSGEDWWTDYGSRSGRSSYSSYSYTPRSYGGWGGGGGGGSSYEMEGSDGSADNPYVAPLRMNTPEIQGWRPLPDASMDWRSFMNLLGPEKVKQWRGRG